MPFSRYGIIFMREVLLFGSYYTFRFEKEQQTFFFIFQLSLQPRSSGEPSYFRHGDVLSTSGEIYWASKIALP